MKLLSLVLLLTICSCDSRNNQKIKEDTLHQDSIERINFSVLVNIESIRLDIKFFSN